MVTHPRRFKKEKKTEALPTEEIVTSIKGFDPLDDRIMAMLGRMDDLAAAIDRTGLVTALTVLADKLDEAECDHAAEMLREIAEDVREAIEL